MSPAQKVSGLVASASFLLLTTYIKKEMEIRSLSLSELATCLPREQEEPLLGFLCFTVLRYVYISEQYSTADQRIEAVAQAYTSPALMAWGF